MIGKRMIFPKMLDYSPITEHLFIGTTPRRQDYTHLRDLGIKLVINMRIERPPQRDHPHPPIPVLWLPTIDSPLFPIPLRMLERGVKAALKTLRAGDKVYAYCAGGRHRSVAIGGAILIAQGYTAEAAMRLIKERRQVADPYIWYIRRRLLRFAEAWP